MFVILCLSIFLVLGVVFILYSPLLVRFDKYTDSCTREHKFIWEKNYHAKKLCSISEIELVVKDYPIIQFRNHDGITLFLKNKTKMSIFPTVFGLPMAPYPRDYNKDVNDINHYILSGSDVINCPLILKFSTHILIGWGFVIFSIFGLYSTFIK